MTKNLYGGKMPKLDETDKANLEKGLRLLEAYIIAIIANANHTDYCQSVEETRQRMIDFIEQNSGFEKGGHK